MILAVFAPACARAAEDPPHQRMPNAAALVDLLQWPAMLITVGAAYLVGSTRPGRRKVGFWCFLLSNVLWSVWGLHTRAWALIVLQVSLAALNIRGVKKNERARAAAPDPAA